MSYLFNILLLLCKGYKKQCSTRSTRWKEKSLHTVMYFRFERKGIALKAAFLQLGTMEAQTPVSAALPAMQN